MGRPPGVRGITGPPLESTPHLHSFQDEAVGARAGAGTWTAGSGRPQQRGLGSWCVGCCGPRGVGCAFRVIFADGASGVEGARGPTWLPESARKADTEHTLGTQTATLSPNSGWTLLFLGVWRRQFWASCEPHDQST